MQKEGLGFRSQSVHTISIVSPFYHRWNLALSGLDISSRLFPTPNRDLQFRSHSPLFRLSSILHISLAFSVAPRLLTVASTFCSAEFVNSTSVQFAITPCPSLGGLALTPQRPPSSSTPQVLWQLSAGTMLAAPARRRIALCGNCDSGPQLASLSIALLADVRSVTRLELV